MNKTLLVAMVLMVILLSTACANGQVGSAATVDAADSTIAASSAATDDTTAAGGEASSVEADDTTAADENHPEVVETASGDPNADAPGDDASVTLYITLDRGQNFVEVPVALEDAQIADYTETQLASLLLAEIANTTGWNLDLAEEITSGKGGFGICFASTSSLFVGPSDPQVDAFFVYDAYGLTEAILDSVKYTLQYNFVDATLGDPSSLDVYFYGENDTDLTLASIDAYVPMTEPYSDIYFN